MSCEDELRPISLTACLSKILEDFVARWIMDDVVNNWLKTLNAQSHYLIRVCFVDFSKAFDPINHNILVTKLLSLGVRESLIPWICDLLSNRPRSVKIDGFQSDYWAFVNGNIPQGT